MLSAAFIGQGTAGFSQHAAHMRSNVPIADYGSKLIEVVDNGKGISPKDYPALALKYHTSKLQTFNDLTVRPRNSLSLS